MAALKFKLGQCVITTNARDTLHPQDVPDSIVRHGQGDWGELCPEDREQNERALTICGQPIIPARDASGPWGCRWTTPTPTPVCDRRVGRFTLERKPAC